MPDDDRVPSRPREIYVLGLDEANRAELEWVRNAERYRFHGLLTIDQLQHGDIQIAELIDEAYATLKTADPPPDAIVAFWDFPAVTLVPVLSGRLGLRSTSLESVLRCEHKYWSRLVQRDVTDALPRFSLVDLDADPDPVQPDLSHPFWIKPVKGFSSDLAFEITGAASWRSALAETRERVGRVGEPFTWLLEQADLPPEIAGIGPHACIAEEALSGARAATEGFVHDGEVVIYGILDSIPYPGRSSFLRHQYPSMLPESTRERLEEVSRTVIAAIGLSGCTFSIEFFADPDTDAVHVLEVNARHSQSHAQLFRLVDGAPTNHEAMLALALGERPEPPRREGPYAIAAKFYHRHFSDGVLRRGPSPDDVARIERDVPGVTVRPLLADGARLAAQTERQDSYSVELTEVFVGADSEAELSEKYDRVIEALPYRFETAEGAEAS
jgi:ATP-grasp domain-containing protein